jgi:type I restriction enzyme S subunit
MHEVDKYSRGIVKDRNRLYWDEFKQIPSAFPPTNEQKTIADFLDGNAKMIRRLVSAKGQLIALLNEQKQAIIHRAVTRGLDPNVHLKPSGITWFGDVPEHWEVKKLKYLCNAIFGGSTPPSGQPECWDGEVVWVTPQDIGQGDRLRDSARRITRVGLASCSTVLVPAGSIIITSRAPVGNVAVAEIELCTNQGCKALLLRPECLLSDFAFLLLQTFKDELQSLATGTTFTEISTSRLASVKVTLPPLPEQEDIVRLVAVSTEALNDAIEQARRKIDLLHEYRARLITDVVTGKLDVRGVELPALDEAEALAEWETDKDTEADEMDEREGVDA